MTIHGAYLVDLRGAQFDDAASSTWIHAMGLGKFHHPVHGEINLTPERIQRFADSVSKRVRGIDLDIDYDHKAHGGEAAGWIRNAEARSNGLWILVEWTKTAYAKIKEGAYRYFSPEFLDEWEHPESRQKFTDVLFGGGITNRPFLKNLVPINMTEFVNSSGGTSMDPAEVLKQLAKMFGLPEDTDPGVILGHAQAKMGEKPDGEGDGEQQQQQSGGEQKPEQKTPEQIAADEKAAADAKALAEKNGGVALTEEMVKNLPFVKSLMETVVAQGKKLDEDTVGQALVQLSEKAASKQLAIPPVIKDGLKKQLSELPPANRPALVALMESMIENGQLGVKLSEDGRTGGQNGSKSAHETLNAAVTKKLSEGEGKITYADAVDAVARENPQLYVDYQRELVNS